MNEFMTKKEVSELLDVSQRMIDILRTREGLPCINASGILRFPTAGLLEFVKQSRIGEVLEVTAETFPLVGSPAVRSLLHCGESTLHKMRDDGLPHFRFGKLLKFNRDEVIHWMENQERDKGVPSLMG